jgi:predicted lipid-binding transport protein (Tim44 family)
MLHNVNVTRFCDAAGRCSFEFPSYLGHNRKTFGVSRTCDHANREMSVIFEIVILAMIAAFLGMRLYSVLGRRAEHEEEVIPKGFDPGEDKTLIAPAPAPVAELPRSDARLAGFPPAIERGLQDILAADRRFDLLSFLEGARAAYEMVLEAFWRGDKEELKQLCDEDVYASFAAAIDAREAEGHTLENRLVRIEDTTVHSAMLDGKMARIAVRFVSDIAALTRDKDGNMIAGSLDDAVESRDVWTFSRDVRSDDPAWLLDETDEG